MNVSNATQSITTSWMSQIGSSPQVASTDPDGDGGGGGRVHHHARGGGGGQMEQALMQALQGLGLSLPQAGSVVGSGTASDAGGSAGQDATAVDGSGDSSGKVRHDLHAFMHSLFEAAKSSGSSASASGDGQSASADPRSSFSSALSGLISQASHGNAPSDLQNAFSTLVSDLQGSGGSQGATAGGSSGDGQVTLQALLSAMQKDLGYGATSPSAAVGNALSVQG